MPLTSRIQNERSIYVSMALKLAHNMVCREPKKHAKYGVMENHGKDVKRWILGGYHMICI